jgi:hypothetical protein
MAIFPVAGLLTWFASAFAKWTLTSILAFTAIKVFLLALVIIVFPIVLMNFFVRLNETIMTFAFDHIGASDGLQATVVQMTGVAAWAGALMQLPACLSVLLTAASLSFTLRLVGIK